MPILSQFSCPPHYRLVLGGPTTNQAVGRQLGRSEETEGGGMTYDIKIENFDISFGKKLVLEATCIALCSRSA